MTACNRPVKTPLHPSKSHVVVVKARGIVKTIRSGQQGALTAGPPRKNESAAMTRERASFKRRHAANIARGPTSPAWWADGCKW